MEHRIRLHGLKKGFVKLNIDDVGCLILALYDFLKFISKTCPESNVSTRSPIFRIVHSYSNYRQRCVQKTQVFQ